MAYTDQRRETFAKLAARMRTGSRLGAPDLRVWLRPDPETGRPDVTRRVTGLREYQLISYRSCHTAYAVGLKIVTVRDVDTGQTHNIGPLGGGTTVWTVNPQ